MPSLRDVRRRIGLSYWKARGIGSSLDGEVADCLTGWVARMDAGGTDPAPVRVGLFTSRGLLSETTAGLHRPDLEAAGIGTGRHGFSFAITSALRQEILAAGGRASVRTLDAPAHKVGTHRVGARTRGAGPAAAGSADTADLKVMLRGQTALFETLIERADSLPRRFTPPPLERHAPLFSDRDYLQGGHLPAPLTSVVQYVAHRNRYNFDYDLTDPVEARSFLAFFLDFFGRARNGLRLPLSRDIIDRLNTPVEVDGKRFDLTRATWSYLVDYPVLRNAMNLRDPNWCFSVCYWWSIHQSHSIHAEDCLVPDSYIDRLTVARDSGDKPRPDDGETAYPLTPFMVQFYREAPWLGRFDTETEEGRLDIAAGLLVRALARPDFLRYIPTATVDRLLTPGADGTPAPLAGFVARHLSDDLDPADLARFDRDLYAAGLRLKGFDLDSRSFLFRTPEGHRLEAAALPLPPADETVDLQIIGPFQKASGLGQATRLSARALGESGYAGSLNCVDFGLDNPAPEGFSRVGALSEHRRARVNLIHLNAESIPLVFAYQPDVFSGAYNIGYFFWELDSPAACHHLGMDMLDEIWVSTDYGVQVYSPHTEIPVTNVGMCVEDLPEVPRQDAREMVADRFGFTDRHFVFLVAFDSFSFIQRKNPIGTIQAFQTAFEGVEDVRLVIKTQNRTRIADPVQIAIWERLDEMIEGDSRIVILDETLAYADLLKLKKGSDCYISMHRSEGWGFGMIEAMNLGVPVVATAYSGNMDFCSDETAWLVDYDEVALGPDDYIFVRPGQKWAEPDQGSAVRALRGVHGNSASREARAQAARANIRANFSAPAIGRRYQDRLKEIFRDLD